MLPLHAPNYPPAFLAAALRSPGVTGAVAPSSRRLAELVATVVPTDGRPAVVELGAGTGAVSHTIGRRLPADSSHYAVEINPTLAEHLKNACPAMSVINGDATQLGPLLHSAGAPQVDAVVSGLPWSLFPEQQQRQILDHVCQVLTPTGGFSTIAYRPATLLAGARRFRRLLDDYFADVVVTHTIWRNVPPALAYICHAPRPAALRG
ncbi:MAG: class I SAM-dependent methyltransferase [Sciscionella sp.]